MSLVGNLEDLSLGDILQIISLSQKSGVLKVTSSEGGASVVFRSGLVYAARQKGGPNSIGELVVARGLMEASRFAEVAERARAVQVPLEEALSTEADLPTDQLAVMMRESTESTILEMFTWLDGDFCFDVRTECEPEDPQLVLETGVNAQYLAMEGLRLRDERCRDQPVPVAGEMTDASEEGESVCEDPSLEAGDSLDVPEAVLASPTLDSEHEIPADCAAPEPVSVPEIEASEEATFIAPVSETPPNAEASAVDLPDPSSPSPSPPPAAAVNVVAERAVLQAASEPASPPAGTLARKMPVILIDPDVMVLEWVKGAIESTFARVHVFQQAEQGLARIRQYLIRGEVPLVLISPDTEIDSLSGIRGIGDFVKRLKTQAPRLIVLGLCDDGGGDEQPMPSILNGVLSRPSRVELGEDPATGSAEAGQMLASALSEVLAHEWAGNRATLTSKQDENLRGLRGATAKLEEASSRGEVLPVILDFAAELFERVAVLIVRDDVVFAIAGHGIPLLNVDPLDPTPPITLPLAEPGWIHRVLESGQPLVGPPRTAADENLLKQFGGEHPMAAYLGPIESGSKLIGLLYGDQGTSEKALPETSGLEVVLRHAGLALDRAALERALWEVDGETA